MNSILELTFPTNIESKNKDLSPMVKFFKSIARRVDREQAKVKKIDVSMVKIHPADAKKLKLIVKDWCKKTVLEGYSNKYIDNQISWMWLEVGPSEDKKVPKGKCLVDTDNLFSNLLE